jgi:amidase
MRTAIWKWSAAEIAAGIKAKKISSREAVTSCLERLAEVNPRVNAVVDQMSEDALASADKADRAVAAGEPLGVLHGVPVTVKINTDYAGRATTNGVVAFKDRIAKQDNAVIANLRKSGAAIFGRTNTPAFSTRLFTDNELHGRTLNPWNTKVTPGGSSGGAAAAVAVGIGSIGHGNDRAASIRYPAYACGVMGLRPSLGRVPDFNPSNTEERAITSQLTFVHGPLARSVEDLRLGLAAMALPDHRDPWYASASRSPTTTPPKRAALFATLPGYDIDPIVSTSIRTAGKWLEDAGYDIEDATPPRFVEAAELLWNLIMTEERALSEKETAQSTRAIEIFGDEKAKRNRRGTLKYSSPFDFEGYIRALARRSTIMREWSIFLERYPLLVMPVSWKAPFPIDYDQQGDDAVRQTHLAMQPSIAISLLGLPGLAIPTGVHEGIPTGVQVVAARLEDEHCLAAGEIIQARCAPMTPIEPLV